MAIATAIATAAGCTAAATAGDGLGTAGGGTGETTGAPPPPVPLPALDLGGPRAPLCEVLDVPVVLDPRRIQQDPGLAGALADFLDRVTVETGATVRVLLAPARPVLPLATCPVPLGADADGPVFVWGRDFEPNPAARDVLACAVDQILALPDLDEADAAMFSGLLFPILERPGWPADDAVVAAVLVAAGDDEEANMYARPGLAGEAFVRLAGGGDRRRVLAFAAGAGADELPMFVYTTSAASRYVETDDLAGALDAFAAQVRTTCEAHDRPPPPPPSSGCTGIDVLFVIDGSYSMLDEQDALRGVDGPPVFAEFTDALLAQLEDVSSIHVGVVSSQPGDTDLHTHTDQPEVPPSPATDCGLDPGAPFLVAPSPTFAEDFACVAATKANTDEYTAQNAAEALAKAKSVGFLRDDSVVFVVMLTDEDTQEWLAGTTRTEVRAALLDAVGGRLDRLYVHAVLGDPGTFEAPQTVCGGPYGTAVPARRLTDIVWSLREQGSTSDVCAGDLAGAFAAILDDVVRTCESFVPEG